MQLGSMAAPIPPADSPRSVSTPSCLSTPAILRTASSPVSVLPGTGTSPGPQPAHLRARGRTMSEMLRVEVSAAGVVKRSPRGRTSSKVRWLSLLRRFRDGKQAIQHACVPHMCLGDSQTAAVSKCSLPCLSHGEWKLVVRQDMQHMELLSGDEQQRLLEGLLAAPN